jgi:hypothetical protein
MEDVVKEQAVAMAAIEGDVGMEVVAKVALEVMVAVDAAEAVVAITRTCRRPPILRTVQEYFWCT